jgi:L-arabinokinase
MSESLNIAYYCTPHGLGHASRALEIIRSLLARGHNVLLASGATVGMFFHHQLSRNETARFTFRKVVLDSGALQPHAFTVDMSASLQQYWQLADGDMREERLQTEEAWLLGNRIDVVVSDVVPLPCRASRRVGIPAGVPSGISKAKSVPKRHLSSRISRTICQSSAKI